MSVNEISRLQAGGGDSTTRAHRGTASVGDSVGLQGQLTPQGKLTPLGWTDSGHKGRSVHCCK